MSALSVNQSVPGYRRASLLEAMAVHVGAGLVEWAERRRVVPEEAVRQHRDAARRRDELDLLRGDILGAAHSGLLLPRR
ncbi:2-nitropropane dioxygenase [Arthrobacter sp. NPDC056727]|uniref:2-nitropropane dioxygenase n=1 Tax=Arthrobacter sp. NPDC056727 TaxID=3345927 RepID=UPI00366BA6F2